MIRDSEFDFCKECGMEFLNGIEEICSLCGNEIELEVDEDPISVVGQEIDASERCAVCKQWYDASDEWFWDYWLDFDSPAWLSFDDVWCTKCILKRISNQYPDFDASGLEPDTYIIWKSGLEDGIDLGPKLFDIELTNSIRRLPSFDRTQMVLWLDSDCEIDEAESWTKSFDSYHEAMDWKDAGFNPVEAGDWLYWECTAQEAAEARDLGDGYRPHPDFQKFGFGFADAAFLNRHGFEPYEDEGLEYFIGTWLPSGLSIAEIAKLHADVKSVESKFAAIHSSSQSRLKFKEWTYDFWEALPYQFEQLITVGLSITALNLEMYWGLSSKEILKVIDAGGTPGVAADVIRSGGSVSKLPIIERLLELGIAQSWASTLARRGLLVKHLKKIEQSRNVQDALYALAQSLEANADMKIDEAVGWLEVEAMPNEIKLWRQNRFTPQDAAQWANEGFNPESAGRWKAAGADSPTTAKRRRDAGLQP